MTKKKPDSDFIAKTLATGTATSEPALADAIETYRVYINGPECLGLNTIEYGSLSSVADKYRTSFGDDYVGRCHKIEITDSEGKLVYTLDQSAKHNTSYLYFVAYKKRPHWWNSEPKLKVQLVSETRVHDFTNELRAKGYLVQVVTPIKFSYINNRYIGIDYETLLAKLIREAFNDFELEE